MNTTFDSELFWTQNPGLLAGAIALLIGLSVLKGFALWRAARNNAPVIFVLLLIFQTLGIFEILYLTVWGKKKR